MAWPERTGIGLVLLAILFFVSLYFAGMSPREPVLQFTDAPAVSEPPKLEPGKLYTDKDLGIISYEDATGGAADDVIDDSQGNPYRQDDEHADTSRVFQSHQKAW